MNDIVVWCLLEMGICISSRDMLQNTADAQRHPGPYCFQSYMSVFS